MRSRYWPTALGLLAAVVLGWYLLYSQLLMREMQRDALVHYEIYSRIFRALDTLGSEHDETQLHVGALREGHTVVVVNLKDDSDKDEVAALFRKHRGHEIHYYSRWATEDLR